jgi:glycerophosphoryl diester phosphodiesterase
VLIGDYGGDGFSDGFNDPGRLKEIPGDYAGGIWTDRIDIPGPAMAGR